MVDRLITVRKRWGLPHWETNGGTYFVTFRLFDSLPESVLYRLKSMPKPERFPDGPLREEAIRARHRFIEKHLDDGYGSCWLKRQDVARVVADAIRYFDGERYELGRWCVMPNHVHALVRPFSDISLHEVLHSWKSYTAHRCNEILQREGPFWQREYYDHLVRDPNEFDRAGRYIPQNPVKARLENWPWVG